MNHFYIKPPDDGPDIRGDECSSGQWRPDGTCSYCGGARPSQALEIIRNGGEVEVTDKAYKMYVPGCSSPGGKVYTRHFSRAQATELVKLWLQKKINFSGGCGFKGLAFAHYKPEIEAEMKQLGLHV